MDNIVEAKNLRKEFGSIIAVDDISFNVMGGECFGILGPNGAGKTSTIRMIYGFSPMTGGSLRVFGLDITRSLREIKSRIGVCQQENSLDPDLTVEQNLMVFARYFDMPKKLAAEKTEKQLKFIALDHRRDAMVTELSGGMMRRLVIARALINDPELLILDEPTTGLDPQSRHQVWERLERLKASGLSILLTTHYMDEAVAPVRQADHCGSRAYINRGEAPRAHQEACGSQHNRSRKSQQRTERVCPVALSNL